MTTKQAIAIRVVGVITTGMLILPLGAFASEGNGFQFKGGDSRGFCVRVEKSFDALLRNPQNDERLAKGRFSREEKMHKNREEHDAKVFMKRNGDDAFLSGFIKKLEGKADTEAEKQAVLTFRTTVETALKTRHTAVEAAVKQYHEALDKVIASHKTELDAAIAKYKAAVQTAQDKAKADCAAGVDQKVARDNYQASVAAAKKAFEETRRELNLGNAMKPHVEARKAAIEAARKAFRETIEKAKITVKAAFGETAS